MKCLNREELFAYAQHFLEAREESAARGHLAECAACQSLVDEYQRLDRVLEEWEPIEPSPAFDARLAEAMRKADAEPWSIWSRAERALRSPWGQEWLGWLAPACALLLVAVASVVFVRSTRKTHPFVQPPRGSSVEVSAHHGNAALAETAEQELNLYKDLPVLENYDLLAEFDVLSELSRRSKGVSE